MEHTGTVAPAPDPLLEIPEEEPKQRTVMKMFSLLSPSLCLFSSSGSAQWEPARERAILTDSTGYYFYGQGPPGDSISAEESSCHFHLDNIDFQLFKWLELRERGCYHSKLDGLCRPGSIKYEANASGRR